jgi:hypothetical protein
MRLHRSILIVLPLFLCWNTSRSLAGDKLDVDLIVRGGKQDRTNVPISVTLDVPVELQSVKYFRLSDVDQTRMHILEIQL